MQHVTALLGVEQTARAAADEAALALVMVNDTRQVLPCDQVVLLDAHSGRYRIRAISHLAVADRHTPFAQWLENMVNSLTDRLSHADPQLITPSSVSDEQASAWLEFSPEQAMWVPLIAPNGERMGAIWLARNEPWDTATLTLASYLAGTYAHAWQALVPRHIGRRLKSLVQQRSFGIALCGAILLGLAMPVRISVLAASEITARAPMPVVAPIDGVVQRVLVLPNQTVRQGEVLVQFEDVQQRGRSAVASRALAVAQAERHKTNQAAFFDQQSRGRLAELSAQVDLRAAELKHAQQDERRVTLASTRAGVAVIADPKALEGRPVRVGERLLEIADPADIELTIHLPVMDALVIEPGASALLFPDSDPLNPVKATVLRAGYEPEMTVYGYPAYRLIAKLEQKPENCRIGMRGTTKVYGPKVTVFYYLFRRPITFMRQTLGW